MVVDGRNNRRHSRHRDQQLRTTPEQELERLEERYHRDQRALKDQFADLWARIQRDCSVYRRRLQFYHQGEREALFRSHESIRLARGDDYDRENRTLYRCHRGSFLERCLANARMKYANECYRHDSAFKRAKIDLDTAQRTDLVVAMDRQNLNETALLLRHQQQVTDLRENMFIERDRISVWL